MATSFLSRWSKRKLEGDEQNQAVEEFTSQAELAESEVASVEANAEVVTEEAAVTSEQDAVDPSESEEPSVAALLASEAESAVKKAALRKLFLSGEFSELDGLNDYDHDYSAVKSLSSEVAEKLRDWVKSDENLDEEEAALCNDETEDEELSVTQDEFDDTAPESEEVGQNIPHKK